MNPDIDYKQEVAGISYTKRGDVVVDVEETKIDTRGKPKELYRTEDVILWIEDLTGDETEEDLETMALEKLANKGGSHEFTDRKGD